MDCLAAGMLTADYHPGPYIHPGAWGGFGPDPTVPSTPRPLITGTYSYLHTYTPGGQQLTVIVSWTMSSWGTNPVIFLFQALRQYHRQLIEREVTIESTQE